MKAVINQQYKIYRNLLSTLMKQSKQIFHKKYFKNKWNNIKNTWRGIKTIISIKNITTTVKNISTAVTHLIEFDNNNITDPTAMSMFLITTSLLWLRKKNSNIKFSPKHYTDYLS